jgi:hypothetical protein
MFCIACLRYLLFIPAEMVFDNIVRDFNPVAGSAGDGAHGSHATDGARGSSNRGDFSFPGACRATFAVFLEQVCAWRLWYTCYTVIVTYALL